jgi:hypothetical protein
VTVRAVREELPASPMIEHVIFAMRGAAAYQAFETALAATAEDATAARDVAARKGKKTGSVRA